MTIFENSAEATNQEATATQPTATETNQAPEAKAEEGGSLELVNKLMKSKEHADEHIKKLEAQIAQQAEDLQKYATTQNTVDDLKTQISELTKPQQETPAGLGREDVLAVLNEHEAQRIAEANISKVDAKMKQAFGDKAGEVLQTKAKELGLGLEDMKTLAVKSPDAFINLVAPQAAKQTPNLTNGSVNTAAGMSMNDSATTIKNQYDEMRKNNPREYYSAKVQNEIFQLVAQGKMKL